MSAAFPLYTGAISQRDLVSLGFAALCLLLALLIGSIRPAPEEEMLTSSMNLTADVVREENNNPPQSQPKSEPKTSPTMPTTKDALAEKVNKVDENTGSTSASEAARQTSGKTSAAPAATSTDAKRADLDSDFEHKIRHLIESAKRYPTGREASLQKPQGVVVACVLLQRDGSLQEMKVQKSSTYPILDNAAKRLLSNLQYPPMPEDIFPGRASHSFCVNLDYKVPA